MFIKRQYVVSSKGTGTINFNHCILEVPLLTHLYTCELMTHSVFSGSKKKNTKTKLKKKIRKHKFNYNIINK